MKKLIVLTILLFAPAMAFAGIDNPTNDAITLLGKSAITLSISLQAIAIKILFSLSLLQFVITGYGQIASGEIDATLIKFSKAIVWVSFCLLLMTNDVAADFIGKTINYFLDSAIGWATSTPTHFDVGGIMTAGFTAMLNVFKAVNMAAVPGSLFSNLAGFVFAGPMAIVDYLWVGIIAAIILLSCGYIALKVFMIKIEAIIVICILPLSLSFLGLNALRDQGFAPFKSMLALIYRIIVLAMVVGMLDGIGQNILALAKNPDAILGIYIPLLSTAFGFVIAAFLAHKSDSIATSLANGSASLGSGDAVAGVMAAAAVATGVGAVAGAAASGGKSMASVMKSMSPGGGGGSVSNASGSGSGGMPRTPEPAPQRPAASVVSDKPPVRPEAAVSTPSATASAPAPSNAAPESPNAVPDAGSGATAGIGGASDGGGAKPDKSNESQGAPKKPSVGARLSAIGEHMAKEKAITQVSINTNSSD